MQYQYQASIVIPTYNRKAVLRYVLEALDKQTSHPTNLFEVIVVDDGSTDGTDELIQHIVQNNAVSFPLRYFNTKLTDSYGVSVARNIGMRHAQGEYILFLDDDCIPHACWLARHLDLLSAGAAISIGSVTRDATLLNSAPPFELKDSLSQRLRTASERKELTELISENFGLSRRCIERAGMFDERFARPGEFGYEDVEYGHRLLVAGFTMTFNPDALVYTPEKTGAVAAGKTEMSKKAKRTWWYVTMHPQKNLPITSKLEQYAEMKKQELNAALAQHEHDESGRVC